MKVDTFDSGVCTLEVLCGDVTDDASLSFDQRESEAFADCMRTDADRADETADGDRFDAFRRCVWKRLEAAADGGHAEVTLPLEDAAGGGFDVLLLAAQVGDILLDFTDDVVRNHDGPFAVDTREGVVDVSPTMRWMRRQARVEGRQASRRRRSFPVSRAAAASSRIPSPHVVVRESDVCEDSLIPRVWRKLRVRLLVRAAELAEAVHRVLVRELMEDNALTMQWRVGIPMLDRLEQKAARAWGAEWRLFQSLRYCEVMMALLLGGVANGFMPRVGPRDLVRPGSALGFGRLVAKCRFRCEQVDGVSASSPFGDFARRELQRLLHDDGVAVRLAEDRNDIAHGRAVRSQADMQRDVEVFVAADAWRTALAQCAHPLRRELHPWMLQHWDWDDTGVFEEWSETGFRYVQPVTGRVAVLDADEVAAIASL